MEEDKLKEVLTNFGITKKESGWEKLGTSGWEIGRTAGTKNIALANKDYHLELVNGKIQCFNKNKKDLLGKWTKVDFPLVTLPIDLIPKPTTLVSPKPENPASKPVNDSSKKKLDLLSHMKTPHIPEKVQTLANQGHQNYKNGVITAVAWKSRPQKEPWPLPASGAGRPFDWIQKTFNQDEDILLNELKKIPPPQSYSGAEIEKAFNATQQKKQNDELPHITIVGGIGANDLHRTELGKNCILQIASQFDYQEAPSAEDYSVSSYLTDATQGPQAAIEAAAAALHRKAAKHDGKLPHALTELLPEKLLQKYGNSLYAHGYLNLKVLSDSEKKEFREHIEQNIHKMHVLPQWVTCESSNASQMQVFCAAPSFQGQTTPAEGSEDDRICKALVIAQYKATAQLAVIRSRETGQPVPLHLTLVGQGAFSNNPSVMKEVMAEVAKVVKGEKVDIYVHAYDEKALNILNTQMNDNKDKLFKVQTMDAQTFKNKTHPASSPAVAPIQPVKPAPEPLKPSFKSEPPKPVQPAEPLKPTLSKKEIKKALKAEKNREKMEKKIQKKVAKEQQKRLKIAIKEQKKRENVKKKAGKTKILTNDNVNAKLQGLLNAKIPPQNKEAFATHSTLFSYQKMKSIQKTEKNTESKLNENENKSMLKKGK